MQEPFNRSRFKPFLLPVLSAALAVLASVADACTAFVVGKKASATGCVIVGHNNDGFGPMKYAMLPATDSAPALREQGRVDGLGGGKSTAIYWQAVYSDKAKAGKATGDVLLNEHGVIMFSNSGGFMREWDGKTSKMPDGAAAEVVDGGLGLSLRFEVVRRARSAAEGVKIATALIDRYGYGPDARTFTIADRDEAWVLCAVRGRRYVARRCPDDAVMAYPNILPIGRILPGDIVAPGLADRRDTLDFAAEFQGVRTKRDLSQKYRILEFYRIAAGVTVDEKELPWSVKPAHQITADDLKRGFSSHAVGQGRDNLHPEEVPGVAWPVCRRATLESVICQFARNPADTMISLAPGRPCETKYDEFRPFKDALPSYFATGEAAERLLAGRLLGASAPCKSADGRASVLDELMPAPKIVVADKTRVVPVAGLRSVTVVNGAVPEAPAATANEAYILEIGEDGAKITASGPDGERWARVTLDQIVRLCGDGRGATALPCCRIVDWPRLKWRGFMLDTVRNYLPPKDLKDVIDMMSRYKLNLFHWHLTENYAWRLESKRFPELQSERAFLHRHKGKFYTQEEFKEIVDYAYDRGVRMMPEFDFPGHALAFRRAFGFKTMSDPGVAEKAAALFDELCDLAPKEKMPFIHMGTDEVWKRDVEGAPRETLELMAKAIADRGRTMVSWVPGEDYACPGPRVNMLWTDKVSPEKNPGAYFDAIGMYIEDFDPFELLSVAVYHKAARWHDAGELNQGAIFCAWHDGFAGLPYENLLRNQPVFPSCVLFGDAYWRGRDCDLPQFRKRLPRAGDPLLDEAVDVERRVVAQRDRALSDIKHPFHFLRQTDMRWRLTQADGTLIATDVAQATISPGREGCGVSNGTVIAETWIKSPKKQTVGAWIGFTNISRDHGLVYTAPLPDVGEWNRFGALIELNGKKVASPKWKRPGLKKGEPIADWTPAWKLYEADEEPFTDQEYFLREPTQIHLRKGWNHVKLTMPNPSASEKTKHRWVGTFIPVAGTTDHPHEVPGLEYSSEPPKSEGPLSPGGWNPEVRNRLNALIEKNRGNPDAYAVFDFDYTTAIGDLSYVCMWELLETFDIKVDDFHALIADGMDSKYKDDIDEIGRLAAKLKPLVGQRLVDNPVWREFASCYWKFYRRLYVDVGDYDAYLWRSRVFAGYTHQELHDLAKRGIANVIGRGCLWRDPTAPKEKRGIVITPEIKELFRELRKAGIAVYIVSGSFQAALEVATGPDLGLDLDPKCVFGAEFKTDASGRYLPVMKEGCVKSGEKPSFIRSIIAPRHHGADPIMTAGDSMGDYKMLVEFDDLQLALVFIRRWKQPEMRDLVARGGRVVAQGRDETRGCYIPEQRCVEPPMPINH